MLCRRVSTETWDGFPCSPTPTSLQNRPPSLTWGAALSALKPLPTLETQCGEGLGVAVCPTLRLLVTSDWVKNILSVWVLPGGASGGEWLKLVCTLGGKGSAAPMQFKFRDGPGSGSGYLAFTPPTTSASGSRSGARPLLLVTDAGHDAVHLVDVVGRTHAGYVASPGSIAGPRGVAAASSSDGAVLVAVSVWKEYDSSDHVVVLYKGSGAVWEKVGTIGEGQLNSPYGLRFSRDGSGICVADRGNNRASVFRVGGDGLVGHMDTMLDAPYDVEEVEGGWLVACMGSDSVVFVGDGVGGNIDGVGGRFSLGKAGGGSGFRPGELYHPSALAVVPGLGLVVRERSNNRLQVFG
jgi:hypothetical protein